MLRVSLILMFLVLWSGIAKSEDYQPRKNPFGQPEELKKKNIPVKRRQGRIVEAPVEVPELKLTATLISVSEPLVIVNQQMLGIGEEIEGMRLSLIDEGRAVFYFKGKTYEFSIDDEQDAQNR